MSGDKVSFGSTLVLQALPGTQGIYGMVIAILILTKLGILGGNLVNVSTTQGLAFLFAGVPIGVVGIVSGYTQGRACLLYTSLQPMKVYFPWSLLQREFSL